jgi:two-component sensor histidine kinase
MQEVDDLIILELKDDGIGVDGYSIWDDKQSLGMSLVKTLVQQLKGDIEEYGGGGASYKISFKREQVI